MKKISINVVASDFSWVYSFICLFTIFWIGYELVMLFVDGGTVALRSGERVFLTTDPLGVILAIALKLFILLVLLMSEIPIQFQAIKMKFTKNIDTKNKKRKKRKKRKK